jgi:hypothetical protein
MVEVRAYIRSDGVQVAGHWRNSRIGASVAGSWKSSNVQFNPSIQGNVKFNKGKPNKGNLTINSDLGSVKFNYSKKKGIETQINPSIAGIASSIGSFIKNQAQKAAEAPGAVADAATVAAQSTPTATDIIAPPPSVSTGIQNAAIATAVVGGGVMAGTVAAPILLPAAATPAAISAGATGTALIPVTGATVARGGALALTAAPPVGATTVAKALVPPTLKKAAQTVVPMAGTRGKFKVVDAAGKTLMSNLTKQQAAKMATTFGQIL